MLQLELADLKLQQHQEKAAQEHSQIQLYAEQVSQLMTTEKNLRLQLASDGERFQQFQVHLDHLQLARAYIWYPSSWGRL
jgi:cupin superfamily acireductone dioxygenase involved in methionine salvage